MTTPMLRLLLLSSFLFLALLAGCDSAESQRIEDTRSRLVPGNEIGAAAVFRHLQPVR